MDNSRFAVPNSFHMSFAQRVEPTVTVREPRTKLSKKELRSKRRKPKH
jgi:hypothetical protein